MNIVANVMTNIGSAGDFLAKVGGFVSVRTDILGRVAKIGIPVIEFAEAIAGPSSPAVRDALANLRGRFKTVKDVTASTNIFERGKEWSDPTVRSGFFKSWQKAAGRICLTVGQALETVSFIDKAKFGFFSNLSFSLGPIPVLGTLGGQLFPLALAKDALICISAAMGIWDASQNLKRVDADIEKIKVKKTKWERIDLGTLNVERLLDKYQNKTRSEELKEGEKDAGKIAKWKDYCQILQGNEASLVTKRESINAKMASIKNFQHQIVGATVRIDFAKTRARVAELNQVIAITQQKIHNEGILLRNERIEEFKLKQFSQFTKAMKGDESKSVQDYHILQLQIREKNKKLEIVKNWISIAVDTLKLAIITLSVVCLALGISKLFLVTLCLSSIGFVSESLGVGKAIYAEFSPKPKKLLKPFFYSST